MKLVSVSAFWSRSVAQFLLADADGLARELAACHLRLYRGSEPEQLRLRAGQIGVLRAALSAWPEAAGWTLALGYAVPRLAGRADAVLVLPGAVLVLAFKEGAHPFTPANRRQVEDHALDLQDFHSHCRTWPVVPVLVGTHVAATQVPAQALPLMLAGAAAVVLAPGRDLATTLRAIAVRVPAAQPVPEDWDTLPYRPVPGLIEAARIAYARHGVSEIAAARADTANLHATAAAITRALDDPARRPTILFVTGIPGAGKTLCGLHAAFGPARGASVFLTGNPTLVTVLREALARDEAAHGRDLAAARRRMQAVIQALPRFREHYAGAPDEPPAERIAVVDEAQRCWSRGHAVRQTRNRPVPLTDSEPGHLLDIMSRRADGPVVVCLVGSGQEIHDGEGGLAEWGTALASRPAWQVWAPPQALAAADSRQRLPGLPGLRLCDALHLDVPHRAIQSCQAVAWVDAVLAGNADAARAIAADGPVPFAVTRSLSDMRLALRRTCRGTRRAGLIASSGGARLRAEGLGAVLPHQDDDAVARWFLDRWPDTRASDALEVTASEFAIQGLELDQVGLAWDGDLIRAGDAWQVRAFRGSAWTAPRQADRIQNRLNAYRVLLTRARDRTIILVPPGDPADATRCPAALDAVAAFLLTCGAPTLQREDEPACPSPEPSQRSWL